jgi:transglutaminase-like putative cysteine protease
MLRPLFRWILRVTPQLDPWERLAYHPPAGRFGMGSRQQFEWYLRGESSVSVRSIEEIVEWLLDCVYASDESLFGKPDHWQHPTTFERLRRGDCEDHALWAWRKLLELGIDAEFVVGRKLFDDPDIPATKGGHAWVLFRQEGEEFLLEAVARSESRMVRPLSAVAKKYRPEYGVGRALKTFAFAGMAQTQYEREFKTRRNESGSGARTG